jgi:hypothetical protein
MTRLLGAVAACGLVAFVACGGSAATTTAPTPVTTTTSTTTTTTTTTTSPTTPTTLPAIYTKFRSAVSVHVDGSFVVLQSNDEPDHKSPYWPMDNPLYEAESDVHLNPSQISAQSITMKVPISPAISSDSDTPLGPMGMAINGVVLFNQYAAGRVPLTTEIASFDHFHGHPNQDNEYHYHLEPVAITSGNEAALVGVLMDGFPVYGPKDQDGSTPAGLDECNGHVGATADYPNGIYHYHTTSVSPYISGCFKGTPGTVD